MATKKTKNVEESLEGELEGLEELEEKPLPEDAPPVMRGWRNRIVGHGEANPEDLLANPRNWRIHPKLQQEAMIAILDKVGWVSEVKVNTVTGCVLDGHLRVALAISREEETVPITYVELTEEEEAEVLLFFDTITEYTSPDKVQLAILMDDIGEQSGALGQLMDDLAKRANLAAEEWIDVREPEVEIAPELFERHDYLVILFDNEFDWQVAFEMFGLRKMETAEIEGKTMRQKGLGRVLLAKTFFDVIRGAGVDVPEQE